MFSPPPDSAHRAQGSRYEIPPSEGVSSELPEPRSSGESSPRGGSRASAPPPPAAPSDAPASLDQIRACCGIALMAACIAGGAYLYLPLGPVPVTLQDLFVVLAGLTLGPRRGVLAVALFILAGAAGLPVFSGGRAGIAHLAGPTGGYLLGFLPLAFCAGAGGRLAMRLHGAAIGRMASTAPGNSPASPAAAPPVPRAPGLKACLAAFGCALMGLLLLYACGAFWLSRVLGLSPAGAIAAGVLPFLPLGLVKLAADILLWRCLARQGLIFA